MMTPPRCAILGVGVSAINMVDAQAHIAAWIEQNEPNYVCVTPAHAIMECHDHPELMPIYNQSGLTTPDGMAVVWLLRWRGFKRVERVYGPDLLLETCRAGLNRGYRHYFYGGAPGVAEELAERLGAQYPGLNVVGIESPPFRALTGEETEQMRERLQRAKPDIVWVGIGSPRQERWMASEVAALGVPVLIGVGAAFDFLSGRKAQAPRWVQTSGLEWLFRLLSEPGRLWKRYVLGYPRFVVLILLEQVKMWLSKGKKAGPNAA